jgi:hypothetical protein
VRVTAETNLQRLVFSRRSFRIVRFHGARTPVESE